MVPIATKAPSTARAFHTLFTGAPVESLHRCSKPSQRIAVHSSDWRQEGGIVFIQGRAGMPRSIAIHTASNPRGQGEDRGGHGAIALMVAVHTDGLALLHTALVVATYLLQEG